MKDMLFIDHFQRIKTMELLLFILAFPVFLLFLVHNYRTKTTTLPMPPGPRGLPLVGCLHDLNKSVPHYYFLKLSKKYGPLMSVPLGFRQAIVISSASMAKEVMKTQDLMFCSRPSLIGQRKLSYNQVDLKLAPYTDYWREMRKVTVLNFFSSKRVDRFRSIREDEVFRMIESVSKYSASSEVINLSKQAMNLTSTIVCRIAFGKRYDDHGSQKSRFDGLSKEAQVMMGIIYLSDYLPLAGWIDRLRGLIGRLEKIYKDLDMFYQELIDDHLDPKRPIPEPDQQDILDILLELKKDPYFTYEITDDHVKAMLMNIFIAGSDTSAVLVVWAMTALIKNPRVMRKAQEELRKLNLETGMIQEDDLQRLPYLKAIVKETLRLFPPAPLLVPRETMSSCKLGEYNISSGTLVFVNAYAIGRDPETWDNPEEFYPERFLEKSIDFKGHDFEFIPFGAGRRICPGMYMGALTGELALANLLYSFDWDLPEDTTKEDIDTDVVPGVTVHKKNPLYLVAKKYK